MTRVAPRLSNSRRFPRPGHTATSPVSSVASAGRRTLEESFLALRRLHVHVRDLDALDDAERRAECERLSGVVGVNVHLERGRVADDEERVADPLELGLERVLVQAVPFDDEDRAVAELGQLQVNRIEAERLRLDGRFRDLLPGRAVDHSARDLDETCATGVHDAGVAKDVEHLGRAHESILAACEHHPQEIVGAQAPMLLPLALLGHLTDDREHRPLDRTLDRPVRGIARSSERTAQQ